MQPESWQETQRKRDEVQVLIDCGNLTLALNKAGRLAAEASNDNERSVYYNLLVSITNLMAKRVMGAIDSEFRAKFGDSYARAIDGNSGKIEE